MQPKLQSLFFVYFCSKYYYSYFDIYEM